MIEQGIQMLVQADAAVSAICAAGGFMAAVPKGTSLPTWTYANVAETGEYTLAGFDGLTCRRVQIDCYGRPDPKNGPADVIRLQTAISNVLRGYAGTLPDPDSTKVQYIKQIGMIDFFDDAARSYRRMVEFYVWFAG